MTPAASFKRITAVIGMALLVPICVGLIDGSISATDAGVRAVVLFGAVVVVRRLTNLVPDGSPRVHVEIEPKGS